MTVVPGTVSWKTRVLVTWYCLFCHVTRFDIARDCHVVRAFLIVGIQPWDTHKMAYIMIKLYQEILRRYYTLKYLLGN